MIYQKLRPANFDQMVGQKHVVNNIRQQSIRNAWFQVYILGGQFGSGKTTMARIIAAAANCTNKDANGNPCGKCEACRQIRAGMGSDVIEIDGASNTGVDNIRQLKEQVGFLPMVLKKKVIIIDEVHMLSNAAFNSLLKLLEEPPKHALFILATTDVEKIPYTVRSRSACYTFGRISLTDIKGHILKVADKEGITITDAAAGLLARRSEGAMRNALKLLEQVSYADNNISEELVENVLGISENESLFDYLNAVITNDKAVLVKAIKSYEVEGKNFYTLSQELLSVLTDAVVVCCGGKIEGGTQYLALLKSFSKYGVSLLSLLTRECENMRVKLRLDSSVSSFIVNSLQLCHSIHQDENDGVCVSVSFNKDITTSTSEKVNAPNVEIPKETPVSEVENEDVVDKQNETVEDNEDSDFDDDFDGIFEKINNSLFDSAMDKTLNSDDVTGCLTEESSVAEETEFNEELVVTDELDASDDELDDGWTRASVGNDDVPFSNSSDEEPKKEDCEVPEFLALADISNLKPEVSSSLCDLLNICACDNETSKLLSKGFSVEFTETEIVLLAENFSILQQAILRLGEYNIDNLSIKQAVSI